MLYLLDANTLIDAKNQYYPVKRVPEFWDWLVYQGQRFRIKIPIEIYEEFKDTETREGQKDDLAQWAGITEVKKALLFNEESEPDLVSRVVYGGYFPNPGDDEIEKLGRDPFLISYALKDSNNRCIVTTEVSKPKRKGVNKKIPDVCDTLGVRCINNFQLIQELDFSTAWNADT
ncbi:MAG: DUF4411 family protein [Candidatus Nitrohelix vancouverensis]|uniref:DUF4411 family protein n=1 Tax=Candidatus Nitrohelix vancouverensis TaxID=2705534 RepID=A0A7T0C1B7_9BACT|nr:MAG: DUF4411 family protein [Candidatus Nitrohelix vancouverensis]